MSLEIIEGRYVARFFMVGGPGCDILAMLYRDEEEGWRFDFRLRIHVDDKTLDSDDPKFWRRVTMGEKTEIRAVFECKKVFNQMAAELGADLDEVVVESDDAEKVAEILLAQPWSAGKMEGPRAKA